MGWASAMIRTTDAGLARVVEAVHVERCLAERVVPDTDVHHDPDITWVVQRLGSAWRNAGIGVRLSASDAPARLDAILTRYRASGRGMGLWVSAAATPADLASLLRARRLRCRHYFPAMARRLDRADAAPIDLAAMLPAGLQILPVADAGTFTSVPHPSIGPPTTPMRRFALARLRALLAAPGAPTRAFVAWLDGSPVGAVELSVGDAGAGLHDLIVLEGHRGRGIGGALVERVCEEARAAGRDIVALLATSEGEGVYARHGFAEVARFGYYYRSFQRHAAGAPRRPRR
jgi:ribosomal protein S18 acetylase RimI-like enzyme